MMAATASIPCRLLRRSGEPVVATYTVDVVRRYGLEACEADAARRLELSPFRIEHYEGERLPEGRIGFYDPCHYLWALGFKFTDSSPDNEVPE